MAWILSLNGHDKDKCPKPASKEHRDRSCSNSNRSEGCAPLNTLAHIEDVREELLRQLRICGQPCNLFLDLHRDLSMFWRLARTEVIQNIFVGSFTTQRRYTSSYSDNFTGSFADALAVRLPVFRVPPSSIRILRQPAEFYRTLLVRFSSSFYTTTAIYSIRI